MKGEPKTGQGGGDLMIAYFDCFSGISGDMTLGALVDLGVPVEWLKETISGLPLQGFDMVEQTVSRNGISAKLVDVVVDEGQPIRDYHQIKTLIANSSPVGPGEANRPEHLSKNCRSRIPHS